MESLHIYEYELHEDEHEHLLDNGPPGPSGYDYYADGEVEQVTLKAQKLIRADRRPGKKHAATYWRSWPA